MSSLLYFPHTVCKDKTLLKSALFLFDRFEYIVPYKDYLKDHPPDDIEIQETLEIIGHPIVPTSAEKEAACKEIKQVCEGKMSKSINFRLSADLDYKTKNYLIFPEKFNLETWKILQEQGLTKQLGEEVDHDFVMEEGLGYFMMAMLALSCVNDKKQLVTDRPDAFKALYLASGDEVRTEASNFNDFHHQLLKIRTKTFDFSEIPFSRLLDLRKKKNSLLKELRDNYLNNYQEFLTGLQGLDSPREIERRVQDYNAKLENDMEELEKALSTHFARSILSKTIISTVAGVFFSEAIFPLSSFFTVPAVLTGQLLEYRDKRRELLKKCKFAWLYEVDT